MKDIDAIRRENMVTLEEEAGGPTAASSRLDWSQSQWSNLRSGALDSKTGRPRGMRKETARKIERAFSRPAGWLDIEHSQEAAPSSREPNESIVEPAPSLPGLLADLVEAVRSLPDPDVRLLTQMARRMARPTPLPPMESSDFLPPVPEREKGKA